MTRARIFSQVLANIAAGGGGSANITFESLQPFLTTANVIELTNLYFSNARVFANLQLASINDFYDVVTTNTANGQTLAWNGYEWIPSNAVANLTLSTTNDLNEGSSNLYYTNARSRTAFTAADPTIIIDWTAGTIRANVEGLAAAAGTTDTVSEGFVNKYFTNARVYSNVELMSINVLADVNISGAENGQVLTYNSSTSTWISANASSAASAQSSENANIANLVLSIDNFTTANLTESTSNLYFTAARVNAVIQPFLTAANIANFASTVNATIFPFLTTSNVSDFSGTVNATIRPILTTANVIESASNLYFTFARVNATVQPFLTAANIANFTSTVNTTVRPILTTANVTESGSNLYFTYARANEAIWPSLTTSNVIEGTNQYFTNARIFTGLLTDNANVKDITVNGNLLVYGNVALLNVGNVQISSRTITIAKDAQNATQAEGSGILINGANAKITYGETGDFIGINKNIVVHGDVLPAVSGIFNVGSPTKKFRSIYLGTQTIFLGNVAMGESEKGALTVQTASGQPSDAEFGNVAAVQSLTVDRVYSNTLPITEFNSYIGGNVLQFVSNVTGNLYIGIRKDDDLNKFAGIKITETRDLTGNIRSDVIVYNDSENTNNSTARISILGSGNVEIDADVVIRGNLDIRKDITANGRIVFTSGDYIQQYVNSIPLTINGVYGINLLSNNVVAWQIKEDSYNLVATHSDKANIITNGSVTGTTFYGNVRANTILTNSINSNTAVLGNITVGTASFDNVVSKVATFDTVVVNTNLFVYGGVTTYGSNNLSVSDNMIYLNNGSETSDPDIGFAFNYNDGVYHHGGFFRDASDGVFKAFDNYEPEPDANIFIDTNHASFRLANIQATNFIGNVTGFVTGQVSSLANHDTADLAEGTNQYFTNVRVLQAVNPLLTTANIAELNSQYFTNVRVLQVIDPKLTTANVSELNNQYFTNVRVIQAIDPKLTTANVTELNNLYFTNARVLSNVEQMSINVLADVDITGIQNNGILQWDGSKFVAGTVGGASTSNTSLFAYLAEFANTAGIANVALVANVALLSNIANTVLTLSNFTTSNLTEGTNQYFTNARVESVFTPFLTAANIANFISTVNATVQPFLTTANVIETGSNLYFTNARVVSAVNPLLTTANVIETSGNLYFTNARVVSALIAGNQIIIEANGRISANVSPISNLTTADVRETSNLYYTNARVLSYITSTTLPGNISVTETIFSNTIVANNIITGTGSGGTISGVDTLSAINVNSSNITATVWIGLYSGNVVESTNQYFTNARVLLAVNPILTTSNVIEGTNQYFTNARVVSALTAGQNIIIEANGRISASGSTELVNLANISLLANVANTVLTLSNFTTANLAEDVNLYYTNSRVVSAITPLLTAANIVNFASTVNATVQPFLTTANVVETSGNLYFTNSRVISALFGANVSVFDLYVAGNLVVQGETTTLNVSTLDVEDKNITIGKSLLNAASADGAGITIEGAQATLLYKVVGDKLALNKSLDIDGNIRANSWTGLYTSNVIENTNQYFTNARVLSNVELMSINVFADVDITGIQNNSILIWNGTKFISGSIAAASTSNVALFAYVAETANTVRTGADLTLGNVSVQGILTVSSSSTAESYTGIEFVNNPVGGVGDTAKLQYYGAGSGDDTIFEISVANNPGDSINFKTSGGVGINRDRPTADFDVNGNVLVERELYVVGTTYGQELNYNILRANSLIINGNQIVSADGALSNISVQKITANIWNNLYTANVIETAGNLYFTNARVITAVNPLLTTANVIETSGNLYFTTDRVNATVQPFLTTANVIETTGNLYFTNTRVVSALIAGNQIIIEANGRISANVQQTTATSLDITTADVRETSNLYFTNARVVTAVNPLLTTANVIESSGNLYFTTARVNATVQPFLTTANVVETSGNLYFTDARVNATVQPFLTTANVVETSGNLYFTDARVNATVQPFLTTANVVETSGNLYFNNARVLAALVNSTIEGNLRVNESITTNVIYSNTIIGIGVGIPTISSSSNIILSAGLVNVYGNLVVTGRLIANLTTSDITEASTNLYFTTDRVNATVQPFLTTANVIETSGNLYFTNARVLSSLVNENVVVSNLTVLNAVSYANVTQVVKVYQYYNESTQSLDTVFL